MHINPTDADIMEGFLIRLRKTFYADILSVIRKLCITVILVIGFFLLITDHPIAELLLAILPFEALCVAAYAIAIIGVILQYRRNSKMIRKALSEPKSVKRCPDEYVFRELSSSRTSKEVGSEVIRSAYFQKQNSQNEDLIHVAIHNNGFLIDDLISGGCYRIYSINGSFVCIVLETGKATGKNC